MKINTVILAILVMFASHKVCAAEFDLAERYLASYSNFNVDELAEFYSEDAVFKDFTSEGFGKHAFLMNGKKQILDKFKAETEGKIFLHYQVIDKYEASGHHVFISEVTSRTGKGDKASFACGKVVSILKIADQKVTSHIDYADYQNFIKSGQKGGKGCHRF